MIERYQQQTTLFLPSQQIIKLSPKLEKLAWYESFEKVLTQQRCWGNNSIHSGFLIPTSIEDISTKTVLLSFIVLY